MKLHNLQPSEGGSTTSRRRVGRGVGSGMGKTSGKGHKGQNARSGKGTRVGFEGGQTPLFQRLPKFGFTNFNKKQYAQVNIETLNRFEAGTEVDLNTLIESGVVNKVDAKDGLRILGNGELNHALTVKADHFSASAKEKIEAAGGKAEVI